MKRYEYQSHVFEDESNLTRRLNELGERGWLVIQIETQPGTRVYFNYLVTAARELRAEMERRMAA